MDEYTMAWEFRTDRFCVALEIRPEDMDPADSFEFQEDIDMVRRGAVEWFVASVVVYLDGDEVGRDTLGGCAYTTIAEFYTAHRGPDPMDRNCSLMRAQRGDISICHYFPSMVGEAIAAARKNISRLQSVKLRQTESQHA